MLDDPKPTEPGDSLLGVPSAPDWLTDRGHPDACGTCGHPHVAGGSGACSRFLCRCKTWTPKP